MSLPLSLLFAFRLKTLLITTVTWRFVGGALSLRGDEAATLSLEIPAPQEASCHDTEGN